MQSQQDFSPHGDLTLTTVTSVNFSSSRLPENTRKCQNPGDRQMISHPPAPERTFSSYHKDMKFVILYVFYYFKTMWYITIVLRDKIKKF